MKLALSKIVRDGGTQTRAELSPQHLDEYTEAARNGAVFPPVVAFHDGATYWLADGFHRVEVGVRLGWAEIDCDVRQGTVRDAILHSVGANAAHGYRRTNADKRRAVETLLRDEEWKGWSDRVIAERCAVGNVFVTRVRKELFPGNSSQATRGKDGKERKSPKPRPAKPKPTAAPNEFKRIEALMLAAESEADLHLVYQQIGPAGEDGLLHSKEIEELVDLCRARGNAIQEAAREAAKEALDREGWAEPEAATPPPTSAVVLTRASHITVILPSVAGAVATLAAHLRSAKSAAAALVKIVESAQAEHGAARGGRPAVPMAVWARGVSPLPDAIGSLISGLDEALPHGACAACAGDGCSRCEGAGWMSKAAAARLARGDEATTRAVAGAR